MWCFDVFYYGHFRLVSNVFDAPGGLASLQETSNIVLLSCWLSCTS